MIQPVFTVSEFNEMINQHLSLLGEIVVEGELTRWDVKNHQLLFGSLKDAGSAVDIFSLAHLVRNYRQFEPGMLVHAYGTAGLYKGSGRFRLMVREMVPQGEGALQLAYEKLKAQLEAEGLFAPERKRPLPEWPQKIGLITAKDSSAYYDVIKILTARMRGLTIKLLPVNVQGRGAEPSLLKAVEYINRHPAGFDVVIMARGGGSLEDLAAFNAESLCRAVYSLKVPLISAIGHEDNWSLIDFVADQRASTPSNAAELAVKDRQVIERELESTVNHLKQQQLHEINHKRLQINQKAGFILRSVKQVAAAVTQTTHKFTGYVQSYRHRLENYAAKLTQNPLLISARLHQELQLKNQAIDNYGRLLTSLNPENVLQRGYSITRLAGGKIINNPADAAPGDTLETQVHQGIIYSTVK